MSEKTTLLSEAETEYTLFKRAIAGLEEAQMRQVWLGTWSARDIVAHISGWHREMGPALERIARGERPIAEGVSYEDVDAWNGRFAEARKAAPPPTSCGSSTPRTPPSCGRPPRCPTSATCPARPPTRSWTSIAGITIRSIGGRSRPGARPANAGICPGSRA